LEEMDLAERQKKIDEADSDDKKKLLTEELVEAATKSKRRSLGNIRFIGELYKLRMLTEAIMHECLMKLLRSNDEDSLECLCQLLTTIGQELDNKQSKLQPRMDMYFKQLDALVNEKNKVSSRIRFMLLDTIDLRKNNWVPRRANNNPKTIEQIHKEAQEEEQKKHADMQKSVMERGRRGGGAGAGGGRGGGPPQGGNVGEDGWNTVTRPPKSQIVDPQRLKLTKREQVDENIQLGPGGRGMTTWQFGSRGGGKVSVPATPENDRQQINRYSLLNSAGFEPAVDSRNRGSSGRGSATPSGTSFRPNRDYQGSVSGPAGRPVEPRQSMQRNAENSSRQDHREFTSPASSRSASREPRPVEAVNERQAPPMGAVSGASVKTTERELSPDEIEKKTKSLMEEYLHLNDLKEATECVKELNSPKSLHLFVYHSLMLNLERSPQARQRTGALLHHLIKNRVLSNSQCVEGLHSVLEMAEDMVVDIPHVWQYFGEMIGPMVEEGGGLPLASLRSACQPLLECSGGDKAGVVMSVVLHDAVHRLGHQRVAEIWQQSGLEWSEFVPADKVDIFLAENKLEFTQVGSKPPTSKPMTTERLQEELNRIYQDSDVADELVLDYLKENVEEVDGKCLRALTTALCSTALTEISSNESDEKKILFNLPLIKKRLTLLTKIINGRTELEIEVLFAIQVVIHKKDVYTGAISELFDTLYDEDVVSDATFFRWRDERMFGEQIGRGVAINTLNQFFKWLEEDTTTS
jgi:translation initiation factor 4G